MEQRKSAYELLSEESDREIDKRWQRPESGWFKVNTDSARQLDSGFAATGGLVKDENGVWHSGFARNIGICSIVEAELWGIHQWVDIRKEDDDKKSDLCNRQLQH
ncbi:hypothetical protein J1N35_020576 [Gossypium stocksii]|uniref:RNase H type-1 domain-containing protein n=1 Tax=Gossypium stocksii TaxID=47602 RepID=A0A9D4A152_9ROSI|nr:hypothetical protein J1N35_020576 [Gossypium stocksii]